ncbi:uncharacterized protein J7T54_006277 [Emericellopsis cladophorae]|uniref:Hydantoinase B/oxoprolinase domain-containing protein n=1 Tax=Emericellopsis cladophorae TaxID=2686198 RepID=A0A9P9Y9A6_9HYPO|nr:uncharacterized protein J7T54_006277 [Emericellopsis cladophorae]KAI6785938.1 hypothetical protein J7T54_006277 [Emericellopsis cladophorae]
MTAQSWTLRAFPTWREPLPEIVRRTDSDLNLNLNLNLDLDLDLDLASSSLRDRPRLALEADSSSFTQQAILPYGQAKTASRRGNGHSRRPSSSGTRYVLRCLINQDIPLNEGCLRPLTLTIPEGSILNPSPTAAVCAGNPITSQRVTDVVIKAFGACAAIQGDCTVFLFATDRNVDAFGTPIPNTGFGFGETICGGSGAGPRWHGISGVHIHMTNTHITDVEVLEKRYPVVLRELNIRPGSGGDGIPRMYEFGRDMTSSIVSERRAYRPYGM